MWLQNPFLPFSPTLTGLTGCLLLYLSLVLFRRYWRLRHIPGPFLAKFTDLWRLKLQYFGSIQPVLHELHKMYGSTVRIGPNTVSVSDPEYITTIYGARGGFTKVGETTYPRYTSCKKLTRDSLASSRTRTAA